MRKLLAPILLLLLSVCSQAQCPQGNVTNLGTCPNPAASINVTPFNPAMAVGTTITLAANWVLQSGTGSNTMTSQCQWASATPTVATIPIGSPVVTGVSAGTSVISCTTADGQKTGTTTVTVGNAPLFTNPPVCGTPPCLLPNGANGVAYSFTFAATGGVPPYTWSVSVGNFTACNVTLASSGVLSGTATTGVCTPTIQVTDSASNSTTLQVSLTITSSAGCGTPPNYCARTDTAVVSGALVNSGNPPATAIGLNGAGNAWLDDMNSGPAQAYQLRLTDYALAGTSLPHTTDMFTVPSSSTTRAFNSAACSSGCLFASTDTEGGEDVFLITNTSPPTSSFLGRVLQDHTGIKTSQPEFSTTNPLLYYATGGTGGGTVSTINSYLQDGTTGAGSWTSTHLTATVLANPTTAAGLTSFLTGNLGPTWNKYIAAGGADGAPASGATPAVCDDYRYLQDVGSLVVCYDPAQGISPHMAWVDFKTGQYCSYAGVCGATTGFGPIPAPAAPTLTGSSSGGNLICSHTYVAQITYTVIGNNSSYGGESTASTLTTPTLAGCTFTGSFTVTPPIANPGAGTGINLTDSATGQKVYVCDRTLNPSCTPTLQTNGTNPSGVLAQPVISSVTGCTVGSTSYTFYVVARNAGGASPPSAPVTVNSVTSAFANGCTVNYGAVTNATAYDLLMDTMTMQVATGASGSTSMKVTSTLKQYVTQTVPIATTPTFPSITTTGPTPPIVNSAGIQIHNIRLDQSGQWIVASAADAFAASQASPVKAPLQFLWSPENPSLLIPGNGSKTGEAGIAPYYGYAQAHWTFGSATMFTWPYSTTKLELTSTPLSSSAATMNANQTFLCGGSIFTSFQPGTPCNVNLQSTDMHMSGNASAHNVVTLTPYHSNSYLLPSVPGDSEIDMWDTTTGNLHRGCHIWTSGQSTFNSTPRGNVSQDGTMLAYASDMELNANGTQGTAADGLGSTAGGATCTTGNSGNCRYDIFLCQLK